MLRNALLAALLVSLTACSGKGVIVEYQAGESSANDWYPIPSDAPASVEVASKEIPRIQSNVAKPAANTNAQPLDVVALTDSLGATSLQLNREPGAAWELVEDALLKLEIPVADKDRSDYRFELAKAKDNDGGFKLFKAGNGIFVVLVPQGIETLLMIEGENDQIADIEQANALISQLSAYFGADAK